MTEEAKRVTQHPPPPPPLHCSSTMSSPKEVLQAYSHWDNYFHISFENVFSNYFHIFSLKIISFLQVATMPGPKVGIAGLQSLG